MKRDKTECKAQSADNETFYPTEVYLSDETWMTVSDRATHLKALRAWGCQSEIFTATTREEAERIAASELREIETQSKRGVELTKSWVRFWPAMNLCSSVMNAKGPMAGFFYASLSASGIGGDFPSGGTKPLRERLIDAMKCAGFLKEEIARMLADPKECGYCIECIQKAKARRKNAIEGDKTELQTNAPLELPPAKDALPDSRRKRRIRRRWTHDERAALMEFLHVAGLAKSAAFIDAPDGREIGGFQNLARRLDECCNMNSRLASRMTRVKGANALRSLLESVRDAERRGEG